MAVVNTENWNFSCYKSLNLKSFISLSAYPDPHGGVTFIYCVTVSEDDGQDILQKDFTDLAEACHFLNVHYAHWKFVGLAEERQGCSNCQAKGA